MSDRLTFPPQDMARKQRHIGVFALQCLHPRHFVHTHGSFPACCSLSRLCVDLTPLHDLRFSLWILFFTQPIPETVGLKAPLLSKRAACRGEIWLTIPRFLSSSAISLPVHWLIGRPVLDGASQAKTAICTRCSTVNLGTAPGRGASCKR